MAGIADREVREAKRIRQFANFFKNYMSASTILVAALPVPVAQFELIPTHQPDRGSLSVGTSLLCFLLVAYIFYNRHKMAKLLFQPDQVMVGAAAVRSAPASELEQKAVLGRNSRRVLNLAILLLIVSSVACFFYYQLTWMAHGERLSELAAARKVGAGPPIDRDEPFIRLRLMIAYVVFFALAEAAFVLMATKEYLQELLGLSDEELIRGPAAAASPSGPVLQ